MVGFTQSRARAVIVACVAVSVAATQADTIFVDAENCALSDCCIPHSSHGCNDRACEAIVCAVNPNCCAAFAPGWVQACVDLAFDLCGLCRPSGGNGTEADPYCSIQTAIDNAVDTDAIVVAPGTYHQAIDFLGKAITLRSSDGAEVTIIDGTGFFTHVVQCVSGEGPDTVLRGFVITGGLAPSFGEDHGGGMLNSESSPTVRQCTFAGNEAQWGGGMANVNCSPTVIDCAFIGNTAEFGGGMSNTTADPTVINCTFTANHAVAGAQVGRGGGMYNEDVSDPVVINCGFVGNTATVGAGMANRQQSAPTVINCTFHGNMGSGMTNNNFSGPLVNNSIFWGNRPTQIDGASLATVRFSDVQGGFAGTGNIDADPLFVDPDNGDFRLLPGSPCIDAGDNTAVPKDVTTDLDGNPRFVDDLNTPDSGNGVPPIVDMGAYEFQPSLCPWDCADNDGIVSLADFRQVILEWNMVGSPCDVDGDGVVGIVDFLELLANWGPCP